MSRLARFNPTMRSMVDPFTGLLCSWIATQVVHDLPSWSESATVWIASVLLLRFVVLLALVGLHELLARRNRWVAAAAWGVLALVGTMAHDLPDGPMQSIGPTIRITAWQGLAALFVVLAVGAVSGCGLSWAFERLLPVPQPPDGTAAS